MVGYEKKYVLELHNYLYSNPYYYKIRAKIALEKYFKKIPKNSKVLEFGVGLGQNIFYLKNAIGYDISKFSLDFCHKKGIQITNNLNELKNKDFDVVFCSHVLEHLDHPINSLKLMKQKLKSGGKLILILPVEKQKKGKLKMEKSQHLYCWTFQTINNLLIKNEFKVVKNEYFRGAGYYKLLPISKLNFTLYKILTKIVSIILNRKEMMIVAIKT